MMTNVRATPLRDWPQVSQKPAFMRGICGFWVEKPVAARAGWRSPRPGPPPTAAADAAAAAADGGAAPPVAEQAALEAPIRPASAACILLVAARPVPSNHGHHSVSSWYDSQRGGLSHGNRKVGEETYP